MVNDLVSFLLLVHPVDDRLAERRPQIEVLKKKRSGAAAHRGEFRRPPRKGPAGSR